MKANYLFQCETDEEHINAHRAVVDQLRQLNELAITLNSDSQALHEIAQITAQLASKFEQHSQHRLREYFTPLKQLHRREGLQPYAPFGGSHNPITPQLHYRIENDTIYAEASFGLTHEGPKGCVHGGMIAGIYDCVLAAAVVHHGYGGPTAQLNTRYIAPTPLQQNICFTAWLDRVEGNKVYVMGECHVGDTLVSSAEALFINNLKRSQ